MSPTKIILTVKELLRREQDAEQKEKAQVGNVFRNV